MVSGFVDAAESASAIATEMPASRAKCIVTGEKDILGAVTDWNGEFE